MPKSVCLLREDMKTLTPERVRELLEYDLITGRFKWRMTGTGRKRDLLAGWLDRLGYRLIEIDGKGYLAHRLAWFYVHGRWPKELDHSDGDKANNAIGNLRECRRDQNIQNIGLTSWNSSGFKGAFKRDRGDKWMARIRVNGRLVCLGDHHTARDAGAAYDKAAIKYFGPFAKTNEMLGLMR